MSARGAWLGAFAATIALLLGLWIVSAPERAVEFEAAPQGADAITRGGYLAVAGACSSCHTSHARPDLFLAGGEPIESGYGRFYPPNITPDPVTGIGGWSAADFVRAMRNGVSPEGGHYYPTFPYRWYRFMTDADLLALKAFLDSVPPVHRQTPDHELRFPFDVPRLLGFWKLLNIYDFRPSLEGASAAQRRGAYLVEALGHCGACHTASGPLGVFHGWDHLGGAPDAFGPYAAPNITGGRAGLEDWSDGDIAQTLATGVLPSGEPVRGTMAEYVATSLAYLTPEDRAAIVAYLRFVPEKSRRVARSPPASGAAFVGESLGYSVSLRPQLERGMDAAAEEGCIACHALAPGRDVALMPILRGQSAPYLAARLSDYASGRTPHPVMTPIARDLPEELRRPIADAYAALPPTWTPDDPAPSVPSESVLRRGREIALSGDSALGVRACAACHGNAGTGFAPAYPYLAGQSAAYIEAQFAFWRTGRRAPGPEDVMARIARRLPPEDVTAVAAYYESIASRGRP